MDCWTKLGTIRLGDFWRGFIIAILTAPLTILYETVQVGSLTFDWKKVSAVALAAGIAYLLKNLATGQGGKLLTDAKPEPPKVNP